MFVSGLSACGLISIDPDEIDIADDEVGQTDDLGESIDEGTGSDEGTNESSSTNAGTDDGTEGTFDETTEDPSDTDTTANDTDTGDTETSDTNTSGDGTETGGLVCEADSDLVLGDNDVAVEAGVSNLSGACGGSETETLYSFTALADGDHEFSLVGAEFTGVIYLLDESCAEIAEACSNSGTPVTRFMQTGETVLVAVDSDGGVGSATLVINGP